MTGGSGPVAVHDLPVALQLLAVAREIEAGGRGRRRGRLPRLLQELAYGAGPPHSRAEVAGLHDPRIRALVVAESPSNRANERLATLLTVRRRCRIPDALELRAVLWGDVALDLPGCLWTARAVECVEFEARRLLGHLANDLVAHQLHELPAEIRKRGITAQILADPSNLLLVGELGHVSTGGHCSASTGQAERAGAERILRAPFLFEGTRNPPGWPRY